MDTWSPARGTIASPRWRRVGAGLVFPLAALGLQLLCWDFIRPSLWLFFYPAVFLSGWVGGRKAGILATLLSIGCVDWFFMEPIQALGPRDAAQWFKLGLFGCMGLLFSQAHEVRHRSLLKLARSEAELRALFETAPLGIGIIESHDGRILAANPRYAAIVGRSPEALATLDWMEITHPDDIQPDLDNMARLNAGEIPGFQMEKRYLKPDGGTVWVSLTVAPLAVAAGERPRHLCMVEDITERKQTEEALRQAEARYARALRGTNDGVWEWDIVTGKDYHSPRYRELLGYTQEEYHDTVEAFESIVHPDDVPRLLAAREAHLERHEPYDIELRLRTRAGGYRWFRSRGQTERDAAGAPVRMTGSLMDITEQKTTAAALARAAERHRKILATTSDGFWLVDATTGCLLDVNEAAVRMSGYPRDALLSMRIGDLEYQESAAGATGHREGFMRQGHGLFETRQITRTGAVIDVEVSTAHDPGTQTFVVFLRDITQRKQAEAARQASEIKFAMAFQILPLGMLVTRLDDGRIVEVNPAFETMVGYSRVEAIGRTSLELRLWEHDEDRERFLAAMREEGFVQQRECRFRTKPGDIMTGLLSARPFQLDREWLLLGCISDITVRKTEEEQLTAAHRKMRLTAQAAHVGFWSLDVRTQAIEWDDEILRIYGITREQFDQNQTQTLWLDRLHPDDRARFHTEAFLPSEHQDEVRWEFRIVRPDGEVRQVETRCAVLRDAQGKPVQMLGLNYDLTDIRRVETALRETNAYLDNLLNHANAPIIVWDPQYRITRFNHAFEQLTGYREPEVAGHVLTLLFPPEQVEASMALIRETTMGQRWESVEIAIRRRDGTVRTVLWNSATVLAEDGQTPQATIAQGQDITERKQAEAKLAAAKAQAESANRAKSQFLAHMSHEIRTPMNGVLGLAQLLEQESLTESQHEMVRQILEAGRLLLGILNDILDFSKIEAGQLRLERQPFDLTESLTKVLRIMAAPAEAKGLALRLEPVALAGVWLGDALRLEQMLFNLIGNAIKFTATGEVVIHVRPSESRDPDRTWFRFEVRDTGIGLTPEAQERLFAPFVQADGSITRRFGGTGLGLSICKRLAELMGGAIGVGSTPGQGSVFWFELPFERAADGVMAASVAATVTTAGPAPAGSAGPRLTGLRVLVVDDNHINRLVIERALRREGVVVTLATDGQQALDCLKANAGAFDAVLMDIQMPVLDGLAATRALRKDPGLAQLPVIALTAGVTTEEREAALSAGLDDFLAKPVDLTLMVALLSRYAGREPGQTRPATRDGAG